jgi:hypothetical protein
MMTRQADGVGKCRVTSRLLKNPEVGRAATWFNFCEWDIAEGMMRGTDKRSGELFSYVDLEQRVHKDHPLRPIRALADTALAALSGDYASRLGRNCVLGRITRRC